MTDLIGKTFGKLTVIKCIGKNKRRYIIWMCNCECGKSSIVSGSDLTNEHTKSCGCLKADTMRRLRLTHGKSTTPEYKVWCEMIKRTENKKNKHYKDYGGRGIIVSERWRNSFESFLEDMGERPYKDYSIDRIDNNGNYEPNNCRWASIADQCRNKRNNVLININGKIMILSDWSKTLNISTYMVKKMARHQK